jgi:Protein of unknown function (DUF2917)
MHPIDPPALSAAMATSLSPLASRHGAFTLRSGCAVALPAKANAVLCITQGSAWVTLPSQPGDHFLHAGDVLHVRSGDKVVVEAWLTPAGSTLQGTWLALPAASPRYFAALQPFLTKVGTALLLGALATARGVLGLLVRARTAHSKASAAQGRMACSESMASSGALK